jgi:hypothetical protein
MVNNKETEIDMESKKRSAKVRAVLLCSYVYVPVRFLVNVAVNFDSRKLENKIPINFVFTILDFF